MMKHNNEDKPCWIAYGELCEREFVKRVGPRLGLNARINPAKAKNKYAPDLLVNKNLADLKCQGTPFFKARDLYGLDPQFTVTLNGKDFIRYTQDYPDINIYFWVTWLTLKQSLPGGDYAVKPMRGIWRASMGQIAKLANQSHLYGNRRDDTEGNAKYSYVIDLNELDCLHFRWKKNSKKVTKTR